MIGLLKPERIFCFGGKRTRGRVIFTWGLVIFLIGLAGNSIREGTSLEEKHIITVVVGILTLFFLGGAICGLIKPSYVTCFGLKRTRLIVFLVWVLPLFPLYASFRFLPPLPRQEKHISKIDYKPTSGILYYTKKNWSGCFIEGDLKRFLGYQTKRDFEAAQIMVDLNKCFLLKEDVPVYVTKNGLNRIKVRPRGQTLDFWIVKGGLKEPE